MPTEKKNFVFLHVNLEFDSQNPESDLFARMLTRSIRISCPGARIIQCTDLHTSVVPDVDEVFRLDSDPTNLMLFRLRAFSELQVKCPSVYVDTDMLVLRDFSVERILGHHSAVLCHRFFEGEKPFNTKIKKMDLRQYEGMTTGEVYPFLACFSISRDSSFWAKCLKILLDLDQRFWHWYGDQEALKRIVKMEMPPLGEVSEKDFACLPEYVDLTKMPHIIHFKGSGRKEMMKELYGEVFEKIMPRPDATEN